MLNRIFRNVVTSYDIKKIIKIILSVKKKKITLLKKIKKIMMEKFKLKNNKIVYKK